MGVIEIVVGIGLFAFLALMTLMINPPEKWVQRLTDRKPNERKRD